MPCKRLVVVSLFIATALVAFAADNSQPVPLLQTPAAVQKTVAAQIGDGTLEDIYRSDEAGDTTFDVGFTSKTGDEHGFSVAADGTLISTEVALEEIPAAVQRTIKFQATGWELEGIDKSVDETGTSYDVEATEAGRTQNFTVDDDGTLLSIAVGLEETPAGVQKAIQAQTGGSQIESIDKNVDDTEVTFDVEAAGNGVTKNFTLGEEGTLMSAEVALSETPPVVQATIAKQIAGGSVKSIDRNYDPAGDTFDVVAVAKSGAMNSFTVGVGGWLRSVEVTLEQVPPPARATIQTQIAGGKVIRIDKSLVEKKDKVLPYEVQGRKNGTPFDFSVGPKGRFLGMDQ